MTGSFVINFPWRSLRSHTLCKVHSFLVNFSCHKRHSGDEKLWQLSGGNVESNCSHIASQLKGNGTGFQVNAMLSFTITALTYFVFWFYLFFFMCQQVLGLNFVNHQFFEKITKALPLMSISHQKDISYLNHLNVCLSHTTALSQNSLLCY